jgi:Nuclease-related domain
VAGKPKFRSLLRLRPLRQAGQSLEGLLQDLLAEKLLPWLFVPAFLVGLAVLEWCRFILDSKPSPWTFTILAAFGSAMAFFKLRESVLEAKRIRLGQAGEIAVAEILQELVAQGWQVFHDVPGESFNIDHVAIGPAGIFTIETKTRSKPEGRRPRIVVDRAGISVAGEPPSHEALDQASAQARWLTNLLKHSTSKPFRVHPVVLFPGWFITQQRPRKANDPWVLEPKAFVKWVKRERSTLTAEQIALASVHLSLYLRRDCSPQGPSSV